MPTNDPRDQAIAEYLDGTLSPEARVQFERELEADTSLRAELERLRLIDHSLRSHFEPRAISAEEVLSAAAVVPRGADRPNAEEMVHSPHRSLASASPWLRRLAVAAVLAAGIFGAWAIWQEVRPDPTRSHMQGPPPLKIASAYYNTQVADGFEPDWRCEDDEQFASTFRDRFGQALHLRNDERTQMLGISYAPVLSPLTIGVLGESEGKPVLVFIDLLERDNREAIYIDCANLRVFRREIGPLVLYELNTLPDSRMLDLFTQIP